MQHKLVEPETPADLKKKHEKSLAQVTDKGQAAIEGREEAFAVNGRTSARVAAWREDANHALLGVEGVRKTVASARRLKPDWVDSFFQPAASSRAAADPGGAATSAPPDAGHAG